MPNTRELKMANERRLIDANALITNLRTFKGLGSMVAETLVRFTEKQPTVDAVEVVRCKDCEHRGDDVHCPMCFEEAIERDDDGYTEVDYVIHDHTTDDGFCDRGERREGE